MHFRKYILTIFLLLGSLSLKSPLYAVEFSGVISVDAEAYFATPLYGKDNGGLQERHGAGLTFQPEAYGELSKDMTFQFTPFLYLSSIDHDRTHFDLRELYMLKVFEGHEVSAGFKKIFWGVTESVHLVDIINQTDLAMGIDGEDKLGQPMVHFSIENDFGLFDFFAMPFFRERTFRGPESRLRTEPYVYTPEPIYEDSREENHFDYAVRFLKSVGDLDFAVSYFDGTAREPLFVFGLDDKLNPALIPYYGQISQTGLEVQYIAGDCLLKFESIFRTGFGDYDYLGLAAGFEYTFYRVFGTKADIGFLGEYLYDDRKSKALTVFEDDLMGGFRVAFNDLGSAEILGGIIQDLSTNSRSLFIESSRRFGNNLRISAELRSLHGIDKNDLLFGLRRDDHVFVEASYYF